MKNLKKTIAAGLAMAMALSANVGVFAAEFTASHNEALTEISANLTNQEYFNTTDQYTVIIADKEVADTGSISDEQTLYINQGLSTEEFWVEMATKSALEAGKTYLVRIGGENLSTVYEAYVTVEKDDDTDTKTIKVLWGDVDLDGYADTIDATRIINAYAGGTEDFPITGYSNGYKFTWNSNIVIDSEGNSYESDVLWGDIDVDGYADTIDATRIINAYAGGTSAFPIGGDKYKWNDSEHLSTIVLTKIVNAD